MFPTEQIIARYLSYCATPPPDPHPLRKTPYVYLTSHISRLVAHYENTFEMSQSRNCLEWAAKWRQRESEQWEVNGMLLIKASYAYKQTF